MATPSVIYTALFLTPNAKSTLLEKINPAFEKIFAHHLTIELKPQMSIKGLEIGKQHKLIITGQVIDKELGVQAVLVENATSNNKYPHITIATRLNVPPILSNIAIEKATTNNSISWLNKKFEIEAIEGYFDGNNIITKA